MLPIHGTPVRGRSAGSEYEHGKKKDLYRSTFQIFQPIAYRFHGLRTDQPMCTTFMTRRRGKVHVLLGRPVDLLEEP